MADPRIRISDGIHEAGSAPIPPCADPGFDHRTCDYWEDAVLGSKAGPAGVAGVRRSRARKPRRPAATNPSWTASTRSRPPFEPVRPARRSPAR